jgi:hypothetical protein
VKLALEKLDGEGHLTAIYEKVREIRRATSRKMPASLEAIVRRELEYNSADSKSFKRRFNWFKSVDGIGHGVWALRKS